MTARRYTAAELAALAELDTHLAAHPELRSEAANERLDTYAAEQVTLAELSRIGPAND